MRQDIERLLDLQQRDLALLDIDRRLQALLDEVTALDDGLARARAGLETARRALETGNRRKEEMEAKIEGLRVLHERRRQRLDQVKTPKELQALGTELELARAILAKEEAEWFRVAEQAGNLEEQVTAAEAALVEQEAAQETQREELSDRIRELEAERQAARAERRAAATAVSRPLLSRYDRLRSVRVTQVVVALEGDSCGACHTAVPMSRRSHIRAGALIEACEACGVLLYFAPDQADSLKGA
jgi:uncharacterized protein